MITNLYKKAPTAVNYLTDPLTPYKLKEKKYKEKQKAKWVKELSPEEVKHLKSALSQAFVTTQLQIECIDTIFEIQHVDNHFPLLKDFQNEMLRLSGELREISIKDETDDANHLGNNPHHWQYWTERDYAYPNQKLIYLIENICDWMAMGYEFGDTAKEYYENNKDKIFLPEWAIKEMYKIFEIIYPQVSEGEK